MEEGGGTSLGGKATGLSQLQQRCLLPLPSVGEGPGARKTLVARSVLAILVNALGAVTHIVMMSRALLLAG